jgi:hypothetical protein
LVMVKSEAADARIGTRTRTTVALLFMFIPSLFLEGTKLCTSHNDSKDGFYRASCLSPIMTM